MRYSRTYFKLRGPMTNVQITEALSRESGHLVSLREYAPGCFFYDDYCEDSAEEHRIGGRKTQETFVLRGLFSDHLLEAAKIFADQI